MASRGRLQTAPSAFRLPSESGVGSQVKLMTDRDLSLSRDSAVDEVGINPTNRTQ